MMQRATSTFDAMPWVRDEITEDQLHDPRSRVRRIEDWMSETEQRKSSIIGWAGLFTGVLVHTVVFAAWMGSLSERVTQNAQTVGELKAAQDKLATAESVQHIQAAQAKLASLEFTFPLMQSAMVEMKDDMKDIKRLVQERPATQFERNAAKKSEN